MLPPPQPAHLQSLRPPVVGLRLGCHRAHIPSLRNNLVATPRRHHHDTAQTIGPSSESSNEPGPPQPAPEIHGAPRAPNPRRAFTTETAWLTATEAVSSSVQLIGYR